MQQTPNLFIAFFAGFLSFLSPCVLPLVPAYIGYLSGAAVMSARNRAGVSTSASGESAMTMSPAAARWSVMSHALLFVLGFTIIFVVVIGGLASEQVGPRASARHLALS